MRFSPEVHRKLLAGHLMWFLSWLFITVVAACLTPRPEGHGTHTELGLPPCPCVVFFGRPCPGCGLTTSFTATVHGQLGLAFHAHPLGPLIYLGITVSALLCLYGFVTKQRLDLTSRRFNRSMAAFVGIFLAFGVARFLMSPHYGDHDMYHQAAMRFK